MNYTPSQTKNGRQTLNYEQSVAFNFTLVSNKLSRGMTKILRLKGDIGVVEWRVMVHLAIDAPMLASDISRLGTIDTGLVSTAFTSLEATGLITIACIANQKRPRLASLTEQGLALHDEILPLVLARESIVFTGIDAGEIDQLFETLQKIRKNLELL